MHANSSGQNTGHVRRSRSCHSSRPEKEENVAKVDGVTLTEAFLVRLMRNRAYRHAIISVLAGKRHWFPALYAPNRI